MKQFTFLLALLFSITLNAQARYSMYEFPKTATGTYECFTIGSQTVVTNSVNFNYCDFVCGIRLVPSDTMSNICANSPVNFSTVDYCLGSNSAYDAFLRSVGWELSPSSSSAISMELKVEGYQLKLDSVVVIYRATEIPTLQLNVGALFDSTVTSVEQNLISTSSWTSAVFDLSSVPCTQNSDILGYAVPTLRFVPYGSSNPEAALDIDAIRIYGHDCTSTTGIHPIQNSDNTILPLTNGVNVTTQSATDVVVIDMAGRVMFYQSAWQGTNFIPLEHGMYVVRAGRTLRKVVMP